MKTCCVPNCPAAHYAKHLCRAHYVAQRNARIAENDRAARQHTKGASMSAPSVLDRQSVPAFPANYAPNFAPSHANPNPAPVPAFPVPVFPSER